MLPYLSIVGFAIVNILKPQAILIIIRHEFCHIQYWLMFPLCISQWNIKIIPSSSLQENAYKLHSIVVKRVIKSNTTINIYYIHLSFLLKIYIPSPEVFQFNPWKSDRNWFK